MTDYEETKETFKLQVPEYYNFGFDVVDKWAEDKTKLADNPTSLLTYF